MSHWEQMYEEIKTHYNRGEYHKAVEIAELTARSIDIPRDQRYLFHEAIGMSFLMGGNFAEGWQHIQKAMSFEDLPEFRENKRQVYSNLLVFLHFLADITDEEIFARHQEYGHLFNDIQPYHHEKDRHIAHKKIKIGYLSPDFYEHVVTNFAIQLYSAYDRNRFEVHLYNTGGTHNEVTEWLAELADGWHDLHEKKEADIARHIYADELDILVDLAGHTKGGKTLRVMAYKPAPIQISGIGYFNTTGLPAVDYYLTDNYCDPPGNEKFFMEKLLRLSHSHFCYTPPESVLQCTRKWKLHSPIVFGSFSNFFKLNDATLNTWLKIIRQVPGSKLLLKNTHNSDWEEIRLRERLLALGFMEGQFELRPATQYYLDEYADMDIALDPFPYPGGGTTCEAVYMGVPVVSRYGTRHGSRFGYSLLSNMGLEELTAATEEEYINKAVSLAGEPVLLQELHDNLRQIMQASPVMDVKKYLTDVQNAYEDIYRIWLTN